MGLADWLREAAQNRAFTEWNDGLWHSTLLTLYMSIATMVITVLVGTPLGILLHRLADVPRGVGRTLGSVLGFLVNVLRSFPFFVLLIVLIPISQIVVGRSTGANAALIALSISAIPFFARLVEANLREIPAGKIEAVEMMGATRWQVIRQVLLPEALPGLISSITTTTIAVIGYTTMVGSINGGGLGQLAYNRGYISYELEVLIATVLVLIVIVVVIQALGSWLARAVDHRATAR